MSTPRLQRIRPATLQLLREIESLATTPVVFRTAVEQAEETARYDALGALGVISKPFEPRDLPNQLRRLWRSGGNPAR